MAKRTLCISWLNWADRADTVFTPSSEIASLPARNLALEEVNQVWGVDGLGVGATAFHVDVELVEDLPIGSVALVLGWRLDRPAKILDAPMMAATDKIQVTVDPKAGSFGAGTIHNSGLVDCNIDPYLGYFAFHPTAAGSGGKIRVAIDAISRATEGFWWGARLWIGPRKDFLRGHQYNHIEKFDQNEFEEARRSPTFPLQRVKLAEIEDLSRFEQLTTTDRQFLFTYDKNDPNKSTIIGKRESTTGFQGAFFQTYGFNMQIKETW